MAKWFNNLWHRVTSTKSSIEEEDVWEVQAGTIELTRDSFIIDGRPRILRGGAFQWYRMPEGEWEDKLIKFKAAGYNVSGKYWCPCFDLAVSKSSDKRLSLLLPHSLRSLYCLSFCLPVSGRVHILEEP